MTSKLKHIDPSLELSGKTALVGSSNCLLKTKYGAQIDQYDDVIRFNRSPISGYEEYVGKKCTLRVVNIHVYGNIDAQKDGFSNQPRFFVKNLKNSNVLCVGHAKNLRQKKDDNMHESSKLFLFDWKQEILIKNQFGYNSRLILSIGFLTIFLCIISGITPSLYGFYDDGTWGHYWEKRPPAGPCHDIDQEKKFINRLDREGKLKLFK
jgi:hypothetical protein